MLAIVRAVESSRGRESGDLLILHEPTVFLPKQEAGLLFS